MKKLTVLSVLKSGITAFCKVEQKIGFATAQIAAGLMTVDEGTKVGETIDLPEFSIVKTRESKVDDKDGKSTTYTWLVLN